MLNSSVGVVESLHTQVEVVVSIGDIDICFYNGHLLSHKAEDSTFVFRTFHLRSVL